MLFWLRPLDVTPNTTPLLNPITQEGTYLLTYSSTTTVYIEYIKQTICNMLTLMFHPFTTREQNRLPEKLLGRLEEARMES